jgi:hypothetical protein
VLTVAAGATGGTAVCTGGVAGTTGATTGSAGMLTVAAGATGGTAVCTGGVAGTTGATTGSAGVLTVAAGAGAAAVGVLIWSVAGLAAGICANPSAPSTAVTTISVNSLFMKSSEESRLAAV